MTRILLVAAGGAIGSVARYGLGVAAGRWAPNAGWPVGTFASNVMGTLNVLEACRFTPSVRAIVNVTSDKCYENREWPWGYRENDPMGGHDPYSASKGCAASLSSSGQTHPSNADQGEAGTARPC